MSSAPRDPPLVASYPYVPWLLTLRGERHVNDQKGWARNYDRDARPGTALLYTGLGVAFAFTGFRELKSNPTLSLLSFFVAVPLVFMVFDEAGKTMRVTGHTKPTE